MSNNLISIADITKKKKKRKKKKSCFFLFLFLFCFFVFFFFKGKRAELMFWETESLKYLSWNWLNQLQCTMCMHVCVCMGVYVNVCVCLSIDAHTLVRRLQRATDRALHGAEFLQWFGEWCERYFVCLCVCVCACVFVCVTLKAKWSLSFNELSMLLELQLSILCIIVHHSAH